MKSILLFGDSFLKSITYNNEQKKHIIYKNNTLQTWANNKNISIQNMAMMGACIHHLLKKTSSLEQNTQTYDTVIIDVGGNDCDFNWDVVATIKSKKHKPKTDITTFEHQTIELINYFKSKNKLTFLLSLPPIDSKKYYNFITQKYDDPQKNIMFFLGDMNIIYRYHEAYNQVIYKIASQTNIQLIDIRKSLLLRNDYHELLADDGIHLNEKGYDIVHSIIAHHLETI